MAAIPAPLAEPAQACALVTPAGKIIIQSIAATVGGVLAYCDLRMPHRARHLIEGWTVTPVLVRDLRRSRIDPYEGQYDDLVRGAR